MQFFASNSCRNTANSNIGNKFLLEKETAAKISLFDRIIECIDAIQNESQSYNIEKNNNINQHQVNKSHKTSLSPKDKFLYNFPFNQVEFYPQIANTQITNKVVEFIDDNNPKQIDSVEKLIKIIESQRIMKAKNDSSLSEKKSLSTPPKIQNNEKKFVKKVENNEKLQENKISRKKVISIPKVPPLPPTLSKLRNNSQKNDSNKSAKQNVLPEKSLSVTSNLIQAIISPVNHSTNSDNFLRDLIESKKKLKPATVDVQQKPIQKESEFLRELKLRVMNSKENFSNRQKDEKKILQDKYDENSKITSHVRSSSTSRYYTASTSPNEYNSTSNSTSSTLKNEGEFKIISFQNDQSSEAKKSDKILTKTDNIVKKKEKSKSNTSSNNSFKISSSWTPSEDSDVNENKRIERKDLLSLSKYHHSGKENKTILTKAKEMTFKTKSDESSRASIKINGLIASKKYEADFSNDKYSDEIKPYSLKANDFLNKLKAKKSKFNYE